MSPTLESDPYDATLPVAIPHKGRFDCHVRRYVIEQTWIVVVVYPLP